MKKKFLGFLTFVILMGFSVSYGATVAGKTFVQTAAAHYDQARIQSALHSAMAAIYVTNNDHEHQFLTPIAAEFFSAYRDLRYTVEGITPGNDALINQYADKIFCLLAKYGQPVYP